MPWPQIEPTYALAASSVAIILGFIFLRLINHHRLLNWNRPHRLACTPITIRHSTLNSIHSLLAPPGAASDTTLEQLLKERADANSRLARALSITNTFVDSSLGLHTEFVNRSRGLLRNFRWMRFRQVCEEAVRLTLDEYLDYATSSSSEFESGADGSIPFDHFIQIVVLRTILVGLLDVGRDVEELEFSSLGLVASNINELWTLSKAGTPPPRHLSQELHDHLDRLIPPSSGFSNPIDFVVPTWETMWRVCATGLARVRKAREYQVVFQEFLGKEEEEERDISRDGFERVVEGVGFSVRNFMDEVMRLHPPSKHISRLRSQDTHNNQHGVLGRLRAWVCGTEIPDVDVQVCEVADIQAVLQSKAIWSQDADLFNPRRFQAVSDTQKEIMKLVFGYGSLRCVASSWAPIAAGVVCGTIMRECEKGRWKIVAGMGIGARQGWDGWRVVKEGSEIET